MRRGSFLAALIGLLVSGPVSSATGQGRSSQRRARTHSVDLRRAKIGEVRAEIGDTITVTLPRRAARALVMHSDLLRPIGKEVKRRGEVKRSFLVSDYWVTDLFSSPPGRVANGLSTYSFLFTEYDTAGPGREARHPVLRRKGIRALERTYDHDAERTLRVSVGIPTDAVVSKLLDWKLDMRILDNGKLNSIRR